MMNSSPVSTLRRASEMVQDSPSTMGAYSVSPANSTKVPVSISLTRRSGLIQSRSTSPADTIAPAANPSSTPTALSMMTNTMKGANASRMFILIPQPLSF